MEKELNQEKYKKYREEASEQYSYKTEIFEDKVFLTVYKKSEDIRIKKELLAKEMLNAINVKIFEIDQYSEDIKTVLIDKDVMDYLEDNKAIFSLVANNIRVHYKDKEGIERNIVLYHFVILLKTISFKWGYDEAERIRRKVTNHTKKEQEYNENVIDHFSVFNIDIGIYELNQANNLVENLGFINKINNMNNKKRLDTIKNVQMSYEKINNKDYLMLSYSPLDRIVTVSIPLNMLDYTTPDTLIDTLRTRADEVTELIEILYNSEGKVIYLAENLKEATIKISPYKEKILVSEKEIRAVHRP